MFFGIFFKCVSEQSQVQFYQSHWVENHTARFVSPKLKKQPVAADNCLQLQASAFFTDFWIFQIFSKLLKWLVQVLETWYLVQWLSRDHTHSQKH